MSKVPQENEAKVDIIKKQWYYRFLCHECVEISASPRELIHSTSSYGSGRDSDGHYDSGRPRTSATCVHCNSTSYFAGVGTLEEAIKNKIFFKIYK